MSDNDTPNPKNGDPSNPPLTRSGMRVLGIYLLLSTMVLAVVIWKVIPSCDVAGLVATRLTPAQALIGGGEQIRITGEGFQPGVSVRFADASPVAASIVSPFEIMVTTPKHEAGRVTIVVAQGSLPPVEVPGGLEFVKSRSHIVTGVSPLDVLSKGNEDLRILGDRFLSNAQVIFGQGKPIRAQFVSPGELRVRTAELQVGPIDLTVQQQGESVTLVNGLQVVESRATNPAPVPGAPLQITGVEPVNASVLGGDAVTITGSGFTPTTRVRFGGLPARAVHVDGSRFITAVTPMHAAGVVSVMVANDLAVSALDGRFGFTCPAVPDNTMVLLIFLAGALGGLVHALRSFAAYAGHQDLLRSWVWWYFFLPFSSSSLAFVFYLVIRAGLYQPSGGTSFLLVGLAALVGMFSTQATDKLKAVAEGIFTKVESGKNPLKTSVTPSKQKLILEPNKGPIAGGNTVTIKGTGFADVSKVKVKFGDLESVPTRVDDNTLTAVAPARNAAGNVSVVVKVDDKPDVEQAGEYSYT